MPIHTATEFRYAGRRRAQNRKTHTSYRWHSPKPMRLGNAQKCGGWFNGAGALNRRLCEKEENELLLRYGDDICEEKLGRGVAGSVVALSLILPPGDEVPPPCVAGMPRLDRICARRHLLDELAWRSLNLIGS
jgi:hypothetical protein